MIPSRIVDYLKKAGMPFSRRWHPRAISAQEVASAIHVSGYQVAKSVLVEANGRRYLAVLPATEMLDEDRFAYLVGAKKARLLQESEFAHLFPDCELGAEPALGSLYGLPVVVDSCLTEEENIIFRAGSHEETIEMRYRDFEALEKPLVGHVGGAHGFLEEPSEPRPTM